MLEQLERTKKVVVLTASLPFGRGSRVTSEGSRVNGRGSKNPPQLFLNFFSI